MKLKKYVGFFNLTNAFHYDHYELLSSLAFARAVHPCSKNKTFHDILPNLYDTYKYSYDQLLDGLSFLGANYSKFVEIFTAQVRAVYGIDTSKSYFDCTNFYFEMDREDDFRRKGPSKENKKEPLVGLGLLLDRHQIPVGMKLYSGNESEKPILRNVIAQLKNQNHIIDKTVHVADKGLNCAQNIAFSKKMKTVTYSQNPFRCFLKKKKYGCYSKTIIKKFVIAQTNSYTDLNPLEFPQNAI